MIRDEMEKEEGFAWDVQAGFHAASLVLATACGLRSC